jgi:hypothetical protein
VLLATDTAKFCTYVLDIRIVEKKYYFGCDVTAAFAEMH